MKSIIIPILAIITYIFISPYSNQYVWTEATSSATYNPTDGHAIVYLPAIDSFYKIFGWNEDSTPALMNRVWRAKTLGGTWTELDTCTCNGRHSFGYVVTDSSTVIVWGGDYNNDILEFDGTSWTTLDTVGEMGDFRAYFNGSNGDSIVWAMGWNDQGGFSSYNTVLNYQMWSWRKATGKRLLADSIPMAGRGSVYGLPYIYDSWWFVGGATPDTLVTSVFYNQVENVVQYQPATNKAINHGRYSFLGGAYSNVFIWDSLLYSVAGYEDPGYPVAGNNTKWFLRYNFTGGWVRLADPPWAAQHAASALVKGDSVIIAAGSGTGTVGNWIYVLTNKKNL